MTALADMTSTLQIMRTKEDKKIQGSVAIRNSVTKEMGEKRRTKVRIDESKGH